MRKIFAFLLTFLARFIAVLLAALTVFATILVLLLTSFDHTLFNAETYKRALLEHKVYEQFPALVSEQLPTIQGWLANPCAEYPLACAIYGAAPEAQACLTKSLGAAALAEIGSGSRKPTDVETQIAQACLYQFSTSRPTSYGPRLGSNQKALLNDLTPAQWEVLLTHLLPPDVAQKMIETALDEILAYFKGEVATARIPLTALKARLTGPAGDELIKRLLQDQPRCTEEQQAQINAPDFGSHQGGRPIYCAAEGNTLRKLSAEEQTRLNQAAAEIPATAILIQPPSESDPLPGWGLLGKTPQAVQQRIYSSIGFSPLLVLCLLLLVALFGVRSLRGWMRWWAIPIFTGALLTLGIGIAGLIRFEWAWVKYAVPEIPPTVGPRLSAIEHQLSHTLVNDLALWIVLEAGLLSLLALGVLIASARVRPPPDPSLPPLAPPGRPGGPLVVRPPSKRKQKRW